MHHQADYLSTSLRHMIILLIIRSSSYERSLYRIYMLHKSFGLTQISISSAIHIKDAYTCDEICTLGTVRDVTKDGA